MSIPQLDEEKKKKKDMGYVYRTRVSPWPSFSNSGSEALNEKHMRELHPRQNSGKDSDLF